MPATINSGSRPASKRNRKMSSTLATERRDEQEIDDAFVVGLALAQIARTNTIEMPVLAGRAIIEFLTLRATCARVEDVEWYLAHWSRARIQRALATGVAHGEFEVVELPGDDEPLFRVDGGVRPLSDDAMFVVFEISGIGFRYIVADGSGGPDRLGGAVSASSDPLDDRNYERALWEIGRMFGRDRVMIHSREPFAVAVCGC